MDMNEQDESRNVEDVRGSSGGGFRPVHGISLGTVAVALIAGWIFGINPLQLLGLLSSGGGPTAQSGPPPQATPVDPNDPQVKFVSQILRSTEQVWGDVFQSMGRTYQEPKLRLYRDSYPTACGEGEAAAGPFYCPADDRNVYLDLGFFDELHRRFGAPGEFAQAYVIASRGGSSRPESDGHHRTRRRTALARQRSGVERAERQTRATGGLLRRCLGNTRAERARLALSARRC